MAALYRGPCYCEVVVRESYVVLLALRYAFASRRGARRLRAPMLAVAGITLGSAALTVVLAVTSGFQDEFESKVLGVHAHVTVRQPASDFAGHRELLARVETLAPGVVAAEPYVWAETLASDGHGHIAGVGIKGVDPSRVRDVLDLDEHMVAGTLDTLGDSGPGLGGHPAIVIGAVLARKLHVGIGDDLNVVRHVVDAGGLPRVETLEFRITGLFQVGFDEYDRRVGYTSLAHAQTLLGRGDRVHGVELRLADHHQAPRVAAAIARELPPTFMAESWGELNKNLFDLLRMQKTVLVIVLVLIIAVACVNLVSTLTMMVADRVREIAILGAMGARPPELGRVFVLVGALVGALGTALGVGLGLAVLLGLGRHGIALDPRVYVIDHLPLTIRVREVVEVAVASMVLCLAVTVPPSVRAARMRPVRALASG
jgi:lipoprotein-releasing system permease protein